VTDGWPVCHVGFTLYSYWYGTGLDVIVFGSMDHGLNPVCDRNRIFF